MSQAGKKRKIGAAGKEDIFCSTPELKATVSRAAAQNSADGTWVYWHPSKCLDQIKALQINFEEYYYFNTKTCLLRCAPVNGVNCKICGSEVKYILKFIF